MTRLGRIAVAQASCLVMFVLGAFWALQDPVRRWESGVVATLADRLGTGDIFSSGTAILVIRPNNEVLQAALLPSCSALASILATVVLMAISRGRPLAVRIRAVATGIVAILLGNFIRLIGSVVIGSYGGDFALTAFHDIAGSTFTFVYVIGSYLLGLYILLPTGRGVSYQHAI